MNDETIKLELGQIHERIDDVHGTTKDTLEQTRVTNGRVTRLEHIVTGDPQRRLPSGAIDRGLVGEVYDHGRVIDVVESAIKVGKWLGGLIATGTIALVANLANNLL